MKCTLKIRFPGITLSNEARGAAVVVPFGIAIDTAVAEIDGDQDKFQAEATIFQDGVLANSHLYRVDFGMPLRIKLVLVHFFGKHYEMSDACLYYQGKNAIAEVITSTGECLDMEGTLQAVTETLAKVLAKTISLPSVITEA